MDYSGWGLCIDIEGFSRKYEYSESMQFDAIMSLNVLMKTIIKIGNNVYPGKPENNYAERLFAYQFGDGFIITSEYYEKNASRCVAIAMAIMRHMMMNGYSTKAAISTGGMSGINGCYPEPIRQSEDGCIALGMGLMTTIPVMGTALTRTHKLLSKASGNVLVLDASRFDEIPNEVVLSEKNGITKIDWLSNELPLANKISNAANLEYGNREYLLKKFEWYIKQEPIPSDNWINSTWSR